MTMEALNASKKDMKDLDNLVGMFDGDKLRGMVPWVSGTRILPNTMIYFGTCEDGGLRVEGMPIVAESSFLIHLLKFLCIWTIIPYPSLASRSSFLGSFVGLMVQVIANDSK